MNGFWKSVPATGVVEVITLIGRLLNMCTSSSSFILGLSALKLLSNGDSVRVQVLWNARC